MQRGCLSISSGLKAAHMCTEEALTKVYFFPVYEICRTILGKIPNLLKYAKKNEAAILLGGHKQTS